MPLQIHAPPAETIEKIHAAISEAIDGAEVQVRGSGGHFEIRVVSSAFEGKNRLAQQRLVYRAISHLMQGDAAPVHAVDRLETVLPE